jgi:hypothetical protein
MPYQASVYAIVRNVGLYLPLALRESLPEGHNLAAPRTDKGFQSPSAAPSVAAACSNPPTNPEPQRSALRVEHALMDVRPLAVALEYVDRSRSAPIARGYWRTADTIIQHPTIHHWPSVDDV